jgi:hypothetical protein
MLPVIALNLIPSVLITLAWVFYWRSTVILRPFSKVLFPCGLLLGTIASVLLLVWLRSITLHPSSIRNVNGQAGDLLIEGLLVAVVSEPLSWFGKGPERVLVAACGLSLIVLFYVGGMATSI